MLVHTDRGRFRECLARTAQVTGFSEGAVEKDYYCSLVLQDLSGAGEQGLVFKGGACLSKVHAGFFRLNEDLDFLVSVEVGSSEAERAGAARFAEGWFGKLPERLPCFQLASGLTARSLARQYIGSLSYPSMVMDRWEEIMVEISLREPMLMPAVRCPVRTLLVDAVSLRPLLDGVEVTALSYQEAYAEKLCAALTRPEPAIRDIFDLAVGVEAGLDIHDLLFVELVKEKLSVSSYKEMTLFEEGCSDIAGQVEGQLKPVVREEDLHRYDLREIVALLHEYARRNRLLGR